MIIVFCDGRITPSGASWGWVSYNLVSYEIQQDRGLYKENDANVVEALAVVNALHTLVSDEAKNILLITDSKVIFNLTANHHFNRRYQHLYAEIMVLAKKTPNLYIKEVPRSLNIYGHMAAKGKKIGWINQKQLEDMLSYDINNVINICKQIAKQAFAENWTKEECYQSFKEVGLSSSRAKRATKFAIRWGIFSGTFAHNGELVNTDLANMIKVKSQ